MGRVPRHPRQPPRELFKTSCDMASCTRATIRGLLSQFGQQSMAGRMLESKRGLGVLPGSFEVPAAWSSSPGPKMRKDLVCLLLSVCVYVCLCICFCFCFASSELLNTLGKYPAQRIFLKPGFVGTPRDEGGFLLPCPNAGAEPGFKGCFTVQPSGCQDG